MPDGSKIAALPMQVRAMPVGSVDGAKRTAELVWTTGAAVRRYDWWSGQQYMEELSLDPSHVRMGRLENGAPLLNAHGQWSLTDVIGVVDSARIADGQGTAVVRFSARDEVTPIFNDVKDGIIRNVSVGYIVHRYQKIDPPANSTDLPVWRAIDWEPAEISLVPVPADAGAGVRAAGEQPDRNVRTFPCEFIPAVAAETPQRKESAMVDSTVVPAPAAATNAGSNNEAQVREQAIAAERERITEIQVRVRAAGLGDEFAKALIDGGKSVDQSCRAIVDEQAKKNVAVSPVATRATIVEDERIKLRAAVSSALLHRVNPKGELPNNGAGEFRYMSMRELAREVLQRENVNTKGMSAMELCGRALHSTSDFANILADVSNKRLRQAYMENIPSYAQWARRAPNAPDFKNINVALISGAPDLQKVLEGAEFKQGALSDGKETYQVFTYGRLINISRQALVNDDLNAFDRLPRSLSAAARRLENTTVYGVLTANAALADTGLLFNVTAVSAGGTGHANLSTGTGSVLSATSLTTLRGLMRVQKGQQQEVLNLAPSYLIVPAALEQTAYQYTSSQYVPAKPSDVNEFRTGGRTALVPVVEALLDASSATAWYLAADTGQIDTVEFCYLDGSEGLYLESQIGFDVDGIQLKARLDFAAAAIDYRGLQKSNGA